MLESCIVVTRVEPLDALLITANSAVDIRSDDLSHHTLRVTKPLIECNLINLTLKTTQIVLGIRYQVFEIPGLKPVGDFSGQGSCGTNQYIVEMAVGFALHMGPANFGYHARSSDSPAVFNDSDCLPNVVNVSSLATVGGSGIAVVGPVRDIDTL